MKVKKGKLAIIDADAFLFYAGYHYRDSLNMLGEAGAKERVDKMLSRILNNLGVTHYIGFFGLHGAANFRYNWATLRPYKGNRDSPPWQEYFKPKIKKHYADKWKFYGMGRIEADDAVIIAFQQFKDDYDIIMVGEDKDARQIGEFKQWNPRTKSLIEHNHEAGRKFFWSQMLHGDGTDNIQGIEGIGAGKKGGETSKNRTVMRLWELEEPSEEEMFEFVKTAYRTKYGDDWLYYMTENYLLLNMLSKPCFDYPEDPKLTPWKKPKKSNGPKTLINL